MSGRRMHVPMGRLFLRIFLWFWLGSTALLLVVAATALIVRPELVTSWRIVRQTAMTHFGTRAVEAYEQGGAARVEAALADIRRELRFGVWLYTADGRPLGAAAPLAEARTHDLIARSIEDDDVESASWTGGFVSARRIAGRTGTYVFIWESPFRLRATPAGGVPSTLRLAALILTSGLACLWLTWYITTPIRTLRGAAQRFSEGDLSVRIGDRREFRRGDELSELAREFDQMAARIQELVTSQQQLLADISHELRSPLARLSLALDLARRRLGDDVPEHQRIEREIQRLNELIEQLLTLARLQARARDARAEVAEREAEVDLRELVHQVAQDARFEAEASGRTVVIAAECEAVLHGNRALLRSAIENVVRNAVRHTPEHSEVTIAMRAEPEAQAVTVTVRDRGPGVPAHVLGRLFDPFYRVDEARDRASGGVGLGLAITRQAMVLHGGTAMAENHPEGGLVVRLRFAATNPDKSRPLAPRDPSTFES